jgi:hypothetical protein
VVSSRLRPLTAVNCDSTVAPTGCLEGTRLAIHTDLAHWVNDGAQELTTLWLNGMAGTGKTAIASTFAKNMEDQGILCAKFFIDRQQAERCDLRRIVQTLAYDLAKHDHKCLQAIWTSLVDDPTFERLPYQEQVRLLIKRPLDVGCPETLVVVIDGLDECGASNGASLITTLATSLAHHPIKLFVTSRNEADITNALRDIPHTPIKLQEIGVSEDVRLYWEHNLDALCYRMRLPDWRSMVSIDLLVELTGHLFLYATSILKIIRNTKTSPIKKLRDLLEMSRSGSGSAIAFGGPNRHGPLEKSYIHILGEAVKDDDGYVSAEYAHHLHDILEVVIYALAPITPQALSDLLCMDLYDLYAYLAPLHSVLVVPDPHSANEVVRPLHQSFPDFVRQQGSVVHSELAMDAALAYNHVAEHCFFQLSEHLHYDMCDLKNASLFNHEVSDLPTRLKRHISVALRYSGRYGLTHLLEHIRVAGSRSQIPFGLDQFCAKHLLHWIELLSLTGDLDETKQTLSEIITVTSVRILTI